MFKPIQIAKRQLNEARITFNFLKFSLPGVLPVVYYPKYISIKEMPEILEQPVILPNAVFMPECKKKGVKMINFITSYF